MVSKRALVSWNGPKNVAKFVNSSEKIAKFRENVKDIRNHAKCIQYTFVIGTNALIRDGGCRTTLIRECYTVRCLLKGSMLLPCSTPFVCLLFACKRHPKVGNASLAGY